ncbi:hypothetical protein [Adhaeretor mobilis]|uniref:Uncharacterized protein n=1 Tax=Adhaeretor mobilis TaxID=1930276 RepID=A0A517N0D6_9BACT|nr:hypothetical protein [Adhaeretor mobilis]QDT00591.1 hypothetical protein HG15A2_39300 [Adhaeretor mobilis]
MDIESHRYFVVFNLLREGDSASYLLDGVDFYQGATQRRDGFWLVNELGHSRPQGEIIPKHVSGKGQVFEFVGKSISPLPSLLTTNPRARWAFSGEVEVSTNEEVDENLKAALRDRLPLCGTKWIGTLQLVGDTYQLHVYSESETKLSGVEKAYCPDWADSMEDDALIFTIGIGASE